MGKSLVLKGTIFTLTVTLGDGLRSLSLTSSLKAAKDEVPLGQTSVEKYKYTDSALESTTTWSHELLSDDVELW